MGFGGWGQLIGKGSDNTHALRRERYNRKHGAGSVRGNQLKVLVNNARQAGISPLAALGWNGSSGSATPWSMDVNQDMGGEAWGANFDAQRNARQSEVKQGKLLDAQIEDTNARTDQTRAETSIMMSREYGSFGGANFSAGPGTGIQSNHSSNDSQQMAADDVLDYFDDPVRSEDYRSMTGQRDLSAFGRRLTPSSGSPMQRWEDEYGDIIDSILGAGKFSHDAGGVPLADKISKSKMLQTFFDAWFDVLSGNWNLPRGESSLNNPYHEEIRADGSRYRTRNPSVSGWLRKHSPYGD